MSDTQHHHPFVVGDPRADDVYQDRFLPLTVWQDADGAWRIALDARWYPIEDMWRQIDFNAQAYDSPQEALLDVLPIISAATNITLGDLRRRVPMLRGEGT